MPFETFKLINLQQRGSHAHSLVLFKSRAITTNPEHIAIFECNGQLTQSEIRVIHTRLPPKEYYMSDTSDNEEEDTDDSEEDGDIAEEDADPTDTVEEEEVDTDTDTDTDTDADADAEEEEPGTVYDVTEFYFSPVSPKICMNFGNDRYNPGYCGIFGMIAMVFHRHQQNQPSSWVSEWTQLLTYMRQYIQNEPKSHGCMGTEIAAKVQEIIAAHPSTATGHQNAEKEINELLKQALN
jgi:hypothetical protein